MEPKGGGGGFTTGGRRGGNTVGGKSVHQKIAVFGWKIVKFAFFVQESSLAQYFAIKMANFMIIVECCKNRSFGHLLWLGA